MNFMNWLKDKKIKILIYACILSLAALVTLFGIRVYAPTLLDIDVKWLIVAAIPIILALIIGRFITRFRFGGFDVELAAGGPIIEHEEVFEILQPLGVLPKSELDFLQGMSHEDKIKANVLLFEIGRPDYYHEGSIMEYLRQLPNVQFFMIVNKAQRLVAIIYIYRSVFLNQGFGPVDRFIQMLEQGVVPQGFGPIVTGRISPRARIIDAYRRLKKEYPGVLMVYSEAKPEFLTGFITLEKAERYLANIVVRMMKEKQDENED